MTLCANTTFSARLSELMKEKGHNQSSLGALLGCKYQTIGNYMKGNRMPDGDRIVEIARAFGVSADYLLGLAKNPTTDATAKAAQEYTGLSAEAINELHNLAIAGTWPPRAALDFISAWLCSEEMEHMALTFWQVQDCIECYKSQKEQGRGDAVRNPEDGTLTPVYGWIKHNPDHRRGYVQLDPLQGALFYAQLIDGKLNNFTSRLADKEMEGAPEKERKRIDQLFPKEEGDPNAPQE